MGLYYPTPSLASECAPPPGSKGGGVHSPADGDWESPNSDEWRKSLALCGYWHHENLIERKAIKYNTVAVHYSELIMMTGHTDLFVAHQEVGFRSLSVELLVYKEIRMISSILKEYANEKYSFLNYILYFNLFYYIIFFSFLLYSN